MNLKEEKLSSETIYEGKIIKVYKDTVRLPNGKTAERELMRHRGAVCVVAVDENGFVVIEKQFRYPYGKTITEIPAGKLDDSEAPDDAAKRELLEETGITAKNWYYLGEYYPSPSYTDEVIHMYAAFDLSYGSPNTDEDEFLTTEKILIGELVQKILSGEIPDGKTQAAVLNVWNTFYKDKEN